MRIAQWAFSAIALFWVTSAVHADIVTMTYSGTVSVGDDGQGLFGAVGASLIGDDYSATYIFNTSLPSSSVAGGSSLGTPSPLVYYGVTINGITRTIDGLYDAEASATNLSRNQIATDIQQVGNIMHSSVGENHFVATSNIPGLFSDFTYVFSGRIFITPLAAVDFQAFDTDSDLIISETHAEATLSTYAESVTASAPEPSTWAMMMLGFAGVGFMAYRKRKNGLALTA